MLFGFPELGKLSVSLPNSGSCPTMGEVWSDRSFFRSFGVFTSLFPPDNLTIGQTRVGIERQEGKAWANTGGGSPLGWCSPPLLQTPAEADCLYSVSRCAFAKCSLKCFSLVVFCTNFCTGCPSVAVQGRQLPGTIPQPSSAPVLSSVAHCVDLTAASPLNRVFPHCSVHGPCPPSQSRDGYPLSHVHPSVWTALFFCTNVYIGQGDGGGAFLTTQRPKVDVIGRSTDRRQITRG